MKYVVVYNTITGEIICQTTLSDETTPTNGLIVTVPSGKRLVAINPVTKEPVLEDYPEDPQEATDALLLDHEARLLALEERAR